MTVEGTRNILKVHPNCTLQTVCHDIQNRNVMLKTEVAPDLLKVWNPCTAVQTLSRLRKSFNVSPIGMSRTCLYAG